MLCDILVERPLAFMSEMPKCPVELPKDEREARVFLAKHRKEIDAYLRAFKAWEKTHTAVPDDGEVDLNDFTEKLKTSQKFFLTKDFADSTLQRLATPETAEKAKQFYSLTHNPMWLEWRHGALAKTNLGALLWADEGDAEAGITRGYFVFYVEDETGLRNMTRGASFRRVSFMASSMEIHDGRVSMDVADETGCEAPSGVPEFFSNLVTDFLIRINSPRITDFRPCQDMVALNKSRMKKGKKPLFSYLVVDLNKQVRESLRLSDEGTRDGVRFHWRRGHFKLLSGSRYKEQGLHWWNPHTAGRKDLGEIVKDYAA